MHPVAKEPLGMYPDPQLFKSLAHKTCLDRLVLFTLAAREFPITAETVPQVALGDQELPVLVNDRTANLKNFHYLAFGSRVWITPGITLYGLPIRSIEASLRLEPSKSPPHGKNKVCVGKIMSIILERFFEKSLGEMLESIVPNRLA